MSLPRIQNFVIDSVSATTTDHFKVSLQQVWIGATAATQVPVCRYLDILPGSYKKTAAKATITAGTGTITPVGTTNGITYGVRITQLNPVTQNYYIGTYVVTTPDTGSITATTISTQLRAAINADPNIHVLAAGSSTVTLTAETPYATFDVEIVNAGLGLTYAAGTPGVYTFGITPYYDLLRCGLTTSDFTGSTAGYTKISFVANVPASDNTFSAAQPTTFNVFINTDDADAAALIAAIKDLFDASQTVLDDVQLVS
jgi:hypothetical protein